MELERKCPRCGAPLCERMNRKTKEKFYGCGGYPKCKYSRPLDQNITLTVDYEKALKEKQKTKVAEAIELAQELIAGEDWSHGKVSDEEVPF